MKQNNLEKRILFCSQVITHTAPIPIGTQIEKCDDCQMPVYIAPSTYKNKNKYYFKNICQICLLKYKNLKFCGFMSGQIEEIKECLLDLLDEVD